VVLPCDRATTVMTRVAEPVEYRNGSDEPFGLAATCTAGLGAARWVLLGFGAARCVLAARRTGAAVVLA
jgi:hypothetical protein